jgi:hypothetical protein
MRNVNGALVIIIGFLLLYVAVTGKIDCLLTCWQCLTGSGGVKTETGPAGTGGGVSW